MNNEISSKSLSLSSVDATLAAIIPDTPIVSIAGSTLSEITTTTTSTTTTPTPTPTPTSYETNKADISSSSSVGGHSIPSMSGVPTKIAGAAANRATASSILTPNSTNDSAATTTIASTATKTPTNIADSTSANSTSLTNSTTTYAKLDASDSNHSNTTTDPPLAANVIGEVTAEVGAGIAGTGATTKSSTTIVASSTCNAKAEANSTEKKSKDSELWEEEKFTNLDDQNLKLLLEEAYSYRSPTDKENKSELFLSLLEKAENEKEDITLCRMPTSSRLKRNHHQQHQHHRHKHGGSLQDLDEAVRNESILDPEYFFGSSCGQRNRRNNHNSRQKKYSSSVSSRQREGGSLPNNVNFTNCARLFGVGGSGSNSGGGSGGGGGGCTAGGEVAGVVSIDQQFPFMYEHNSLTTNTDSGATAMVSATAITASNNNNGSNISSNNCNNNGNSGSASGGNSNNNIKQQRRSATKTNTMSSTSVSTSPSITSAAKIEAEQLVGQPIGVLIGGQVITPKPTTSVASNGNDTSNGNVAGTGCRSLKDAIYSVNVRDCVIEMGETIIDVQQQQQILQSKNQEAISQGRAYYDRLESVELMPRNNMMNPVPSRTCFGPTTANAYVDEKVHFTPLRNYNSSAAAASGGSKPNQVGGVDTKYLPLSDNYKAYKSVLANADKDEMREVDENGNAVTETFSVNTTTHASTANVYNSTNVTSAPVIASASTNANTSGSTQATKSKSKKQPKQERNVTTVNVEAVAGYRGTDPVEKLVKYIENTTGDDNKNKQKKERKKQDKQEKHNKIKKSNSLEELRSCSKMEVDDLKRTAATTESNVMMRNKGKGGKNNSSSAADINKNFDSTGGSSSASAMKEKPSNVAATAVSAGNRKGERRSWGTEELQYLGDANGNKNASVNAGNSGNSSTSGATSNVASQCVVDEKTKEKDRKNKNRENQKDRLEEKDKIRPEKVEKVNAEVINTAITMQNAITTLGNSKSNNDRNEKQQQHQQVEKSEKAEKKKKGEIQQAMSQSQTKSISNTSAEPNAIVDILAMESLLPETAEFHVVTKKKKAKKQRSSLEESNCVGNTNSSKTHNFMATTTNLKQQSSRFNNKFNPNEHSNQNNNGNSSNNSNHYQQHHNNNHYHNQAHQQHQHNHQQNSDKSRRKSTSSVPPSEKSDSSDLDSVHSLPIERAAKVASGASANANSSKTSNKQNRQSKNTAGSVAPMSLSQKPQQVQQMPTPFSYADIAKEAKSLTATITTSALASHVNSSSSGSSGGDQAIQTQNAVGDGNTKASQQHPPIMTTDELKNTPLRGHQPQQQAPTAISSNSATTTSSSTSTTATTPTATTNVSNTHSAIQNSNNNSIKANKTKKSVPKSDFPALGSASDVAVAASAARADIFAKAVLNSSQHITPAQSQQQHNSNARDTGDSTITTGTVQASKSNAVSHIDSPKDAIVQQNLPSQAHQNQVYLQQQHQHQQTLQKSKSVEHEPCSGTTNKSNVSYNNTMDHQQYPALKTVKRHSASNFTTLPPTGASSVVSSAVGLTTQQTVAPNPAITQFNFAAAARQVATTAANSVPIALANNSNEISVAATVSEITTSNITTGTMSNTVVSKKNPGATKEKTLSATSITNTTSSVPVEQNPKKSRKEKQQQQIVETTSKTLSTASTSSSRKSTAATQTSTTHLDNNESKQNCAAKSSRTVIVTTMISTPSLATTTVGETLTQPVVNPLVPSSNRPAVIILNDDNSGINTDFTFGDFNEDELHFFDVEADEQTTAGATAPILVAVESDDSIEDRAVVKLASSSPRSASNSTASLQQLNDSGTSSDLCMVNNNTSNIQQVVSPKADDITGTSSDVTLSPNNSTLTTTDNQHNSGIGVSGSISNSSRSNASESGQSNHSGDSGIYTSASKVQEAGSIDSSNVSTFMQQHLSMGNTNLMLHEEESANIDTTECNIGSLQQQQNQQQQPRQQQLETCNEIESVIIAAARRAANQQQQYPQQKSALIQTSAMNAHYQHSNSNSSSFSSSSSVDGGGNRYYATAQSPPPHPPSHAHPQQQQQLQQQQQQQQAQYYNNGRQGYAPYPVHQPQHMQQIYHQNYNAVPMLQHQPMVVNTIATPANVYSRSNSDCDEDFVSPPPGTFVVKIQNKEYDLHYLPPNMSTSGSQNEVLVEYVSLAWDEVINSKYTKIFDGQ